MQNDTLVNCFNHDNAAHIFLDNSISCDWCVLYAIHFEIAYRCDGVFVYIWDPVLKNCQLVLTVKNKSKSLLLLRKKRGLLKTV